MDRPIQNRSSLDEAEIADLVQGLNNLHGSLRIQADILALGARALPALVTFLCGSPNQFPDARVFAAEAVGRIDGEAAFQGLLRALHANPLKHLTPVLRLSEEVVLDTVSRQLARLHDRRAVSPLLEAFRQYRLLGAAEALAQFREPAALPWLVEGLEDAFKRDRLAHIILGLGPIVILYLIETLDHRLMRGREELLPSLERRATALKLLGQLGAHAAAGAMRSALRDPHDTVRMEAALALVMVEDDDTVLEAVPALLTGLTHPDFLERGRCVDALLRIGPRCVPLIERALTQGGVMVGTETVPLTVNARMEALAVLEHLKGSVAC